MHAQVQHCTSGGRQGAGLVAIQRVQHDVQTRHRQDVYRVRMVGHELQLVPTHYCGNGLALAPYSVLFKGTYHLEVHTRFAFHPPLLHLFRLYINVRCYIFLLDCLHLSLVMSGAYINYGKDNFDW